MRTHLLSALLFLVLGLPLGAAEPRHEVVPDWPQVPADRVLGLCSAVGVDSHNRVFVFHRGGQKWTEPFSTEPIAQDTVSIFDGPSGKFLGSWGAGLFIMPHGLSIDHEDNVWLTDVALQQVFKFTPEGKILLTIGERGKAGDDHAHFNRPTDIAVLADGSFYVSDGYRNTRVVKFSASGAFEMQWGTKGRGNAEFNLPHGIALDSTGRVYVCDRSNSRLQIFDGKGQYLDQWKGPQIGRPYGVAVDANDHVFIVDGGEPSTKKAEGGKAVELDAKGKVVDTFGSGGKGAGQFQTGHDIAVGPDGAVYVADSGGKRVVKFVRK